jgi:hypothetical protein
MPLAHTQISQVSNAPNYTGFPVDIYCEKYKFEISQVSNHTGKLLTLDALLYFLQHKTVNYET